MTAIKAALQELGRAGKTQELPRPSASRGNSPEPVIRSSNLGIRKQFTDLWEGDHPAPVSTALPSAQRTVDVAMPGRITRDRATELMVLIRLEDSAGLCGILQDDHEAEARPEDVRSRPFEITFVLGPDGRPVPLSIGVQITSPDFQPRSQVRNILVPVDRDSEVCSFLLTPLKTGTLTVIIDLTWEGKQRGSRRLRATCVTQATNDSGMMLVQIPYRLQPANSSETSDGAAIPLSHLVPIASSPLTFSDREVKRIRRFLDLDEGDLYLLIPEHLPEYKRAAFCPSGQQEAGRLAFESLLPKLHDRLCLRWEYCNHRNAAEFQSIETLIITVAGVISEVCGEIPPLLVATLLTKKGLDSFCECELARG